MLLNKFTITFEPNGYTEKLIYNGKVYEKRYKRTHYGWKGLDKSWDSENDLPYELIDAIVFKEETDIVNLLKSKKS